MTEDAPLRFSLKYAPCLDGMRAIAVLLVMLHHSRAPLSAGGFIGVDIFFVLSGFLITGLLLTEHSRTGTIHFTQFYMRRALRLLPALFLLLALMLILSPLFGGFRTTAIDAAIVVGYIANWTKAFGFERPVFLSHCWSLSIEEQFYILWPALFLFFNSLLRTRRALLLAIVALTALSGIVRTWLYLSGHPPVRQYAGLDTRADALLVGCALAVALAVYGLPRRDSKAGKTVLVGTLIAIPCLAAIVKFALWRSAWMQTFGFTLIPLLTAVVVAYLMANPLSVLTRTLEYAPLVWAGKISYGLYLFHWPIIRYMNNAGFSRWTVMAIAIPATFLIAGLSYKYIEAPALKLKERFRTSAPRPATEETSGSAPFTSVPAP